MKVAYLDCISGISGDMTLAALVDAGVDLEAINAGIQSLGLPNVRAVASEVKRRGFRATHVTIEHEREHVHRHLHHIEAMIDQGILTERQRALAKQIFTRLGEAEAKVHGTSLQKVHFHEVGAVDSIADIVGAAIGWDILDVDSIVCSPIPTGGGSIEIAHGRVNVPAPATAELLIGVPLAASDIQFELTTPTGAAIAVTLAGEFGPLPQMSIEKIGYGAGSRDLEQQGNVLRLFVGHTDSAADVQSLLMVETNLDDATGEAIGHAVERLWDLKVLDVYTTAIQMKKNRPAVTLSVLCRPDQLACVEETLFLHTPTLGVRHWGVRRRALRREAIEVQTTWGLVKGMLGFLEGQSPRFAPEYESCRAVAGEHKVPLAQVYQQACQAYDRREQKNRA